MKEGNMKLNGLLMAFLLITCVFLTAGSVNASIGNGWQNYISIYGWAAGIEGTAQYPVNSGSEDVEVDASEIIDDLNGVFMGNYSGSYDRWSVLADLVYLNIGSTGNTDTPFGTASAGLDLKAWLLTGAAGYDLVSSDQFKLGVIAGVRYLTLDTDLEVGFDGDSLGSTSESASVTDGIIGLKGQFNFNENWFIPYYADIGGGSSDYSYQLFAAIGYRYKWFDVQLGYRVLYFKLDDEELLEDLQVSGPKIGVGFSF